MSTIIKTHSMLNFSDAALVHKRCSNFSQDESSSLDAVKEFLEAHSSINRFALFQCTSVFLKESYIIEGFVLFKKSVCVFSATRSYKLRWKEYDGKIIPINFDPKKRPRRQDWKGEFIETGMFYFSERNLVNQNQFQNSWCSIVEVKPKDALEIDTRSDLTLARNLIGGDAMIKIGKSDILN